ncbi:MAG TPA: modification methylase [Lentisphaeria bacterium]|nr:modification methylase [Lentisphaeria bacterium]
MDSAGKRDLHIQHHHAAQHFPENHEVLKPFLKWAGGKRRLLPKFQELYPRELKNHKIKNYFEPFLGSGAVFFHIAQNYKIDNAYLYDINEELIIAYRVVQKDVYKLITELEKYEKSYLKLNRSERSTYYYGLRWKFNRQRHYMDFNTYSEKWIRRAAQLIFLNKTCYNGLYRVNSYGDFNTAAGDYNNPKICDPENLIKVSRYLQMAEIKKSSFDLLENHVKHNSFVYFDPPYRPLSKSSCFTAYSSARFDDTEQIRLSNVFNRLHDKGIRLMLSNSDPKNSDPDDDFFDDLYSGFNIHRVPVPRFINSNAEKRGCVSEIIITNYKHIA